MEHFSITLFCGAQWQDKGQLTQTEAQKLCLNIRKTFFTFRVTEYLNRLPREVLESPSLEILKTWLDVILCNLLQVNLLSQGVELDDLQRSLPTPAIL